ncbi:alcohol dehydrogenase catalytic domain-containing protein [Alcanivorax sp.]|uniref:alcohol dehydrogenase catalytic domain-containing protein n=1 Tax=Alcanivorax sp. TaxID=1872427 RepID=UPI0032D9660B
MKALAIGDYQHGKLHAIDVPDLLPPASGEVQLSLIGTSINPFDQKLVKGYGAPLFNPGQRFPVIPGRDAVARIEAIGNKVKGLEAGQRVLVASTARSGGTYSRRFNLPLKCLTPLNDNRLTDSQAAGLGYAGLTAIQALHAAGINPSTAQGKSLLINGASGGVGSIALVLASAWGASITATASRHNLDWIRALGDCQAVDYRDRAQMAQVQADSIVNLAPDTSPDVEQKLISILARSNASSRAYATSVHPLLGKVTEKGKIPGLLSAGAQIARKYLHYRRQGIRYSWVVVSENPQHLCELASTFAQRPDINIAGSTADIATLPAAFNDGPKRSVPGKSIFMGRLD